MAKKKLWCYLGIHNWTTMVTNGERYLACKHCKKYGGSPPSPRPFQMPGYRDK